MRVIDRDEVRARLGYDLCIPIVREAMAAFSRGETRQLLRSIIPLGEGRLFGVMPGALGEHAAFGAKIVSVFPHGGDRPSHQGLVVLFDPATGAPSCIVDAGEITAIRTAAASAVATDALARPNAGRLAILGYGEQARFHVRAISRVRHIVHLSVWGRSKWRARAFLDEMLGEVEVAEGAAASDVQAAVADADIICTVTAAQEPILRAAWVAPGAHVNVVGSSFAGPAEIDEALVQRGRFIADSREGVLVQGAEFLRAKAAGLVDDRHVVGEIGQVLNGDLEGRQSADQITIYKSLGHIVQDLAAAQALFKAPL